jgi:hypothetical protein
MNALHHSPPCVRFSEIQRNLFLFMPVRFSALAALMLGHLFTALFFNGAHRSCGYVNKEKNSGSISRFRE